MFGVRTATWTVPPRVRHTVRVAGAPQGGDHHRRSDEVQPEEGGGGGGVCPGRGAAGPARSRSASRPSARSARRGERSNEAEPAAMTMPTTEKKPVTTANPDNGIASPPSGTSKSTPRPGQRQRRAWWPPSRRPWRRGRCRRARGVGASGRSGPLPGRDDAGVVMLLISFLLIRDWRRRVRPGRRAPAARPARPAPRAARSPPRRRRTGTPARPPSPCRRPRRTRRR